MTATTDSFSWGADTLDRAGSGGSADGVRSRRTSLMGARALALLIDGVVLAVPTLGLLWLLSLVFPHHGFFFSRASSNGGTTRATLKLGLPGALLLAAMSLSYFFVMEAVRGQTVGKRARGLHVRSASGGAPGLNAISARTVLRLIDALPGLYLIGALVAILTGSRRRRIGDWAGGTVVVCDEPLEQDRPRPSAGRVAVYPAIWLAAVLLAIFAFGLGKAAAEGERAVALVQAYVSAREQGNASLACSMLTREQQRELVAIQSHDYAGAQPDQCPDFILRSDPNTHLQNPALSEMAAGPLLTEYSPLGAVAVRSGDTNLVLMAVPENGQLKLDMRGVEKLGFVSECASGGKLSTAACGCTFARLRMQGLVPERGLTYNILRAMRFDVLRCRSNPALPG